MKCVKYEDIKIADIETITKTGFITEIIFDADTKTINIKDDALKEAEKEIGEIVNAICEVVEKIVNVLVEIRKRFIKLV